MNKTKYLYDIFEAHTGSRPERIEALPRSGSYREYYRMRKEANSAIGVYNIDRKENDAFLSFTRHFFHKNLPVPEVYEADLENNVYLLEDLGNTTLFTFLDSLRTKGEFPESIVPLYKKILEDLPRFQIEGNEELDYTKCYPRSRFDKQSMMWDLNYFKYYFLKLGKIPFDEQDLENNFQKFSDWLLEENSEFFMYRDFQSSNVMVHKGTPYYIDYQGGRKGALQYDIASLLWDAKADIPGDIRNYLFDHYIKALKSHIPIDEKKFREYYIGFSLIRMMQALGAFGFRGFYEKKPGFLKSIPFALKHLTYLLSHYTLAIDIPHLVYVLKSLPDAPELQQFVSTREFQGKLVVEINSFSYRRGIPVDLSEHGGGFVFDCRAIHNPGRYDRFKEKNGLNDDVIRFLQTESDADLFVNDAFNLVKTSIETYIKKKYTHLMINFGCTGGQHRSVYCAEKMKKHLEKHFTNGIDIVIYHREQELKKLGI